MNDKFIKIILAAVIVIFLLLCVNTCNSCALSRRVDELGARQTHALTKSDSTAAAMSRAFDINLQMMQPQIVNSFLYLFDSEKYKNEIGLNDLKLQALKLQLKNITGNDTTRKHK